MNDIVDIRKPLDILKNALLDSCPGNHLDVLENGAVYSDYAVIPFDMKEVRVSDKKGKRVISDYEELKEWWNNEK